MLVPAIGSYRFCRLSMAFSFFRLSKSSSLGRSRLRFFIAPDRVLSVSLQMASFCGSSRTRTCVSCVVDMSFETVANKLECIL